MHSSDRQGLRRKEVYENKWLKEIVVVEWTECQAMEFINYGG